MPDTIHSVAAKSLRGTIYVPGDKSISHRALIFAAIAEGVSEIVGFLAAEDCLATMQALMRLGVSIEVGDNLMRVRGYRNGLHSLEQPIDLANSGTAMRLLTGLLAGKKISVTLNGDASLNRRPMRRVVDPLLKMGAQIRTSQQGTPPVIIEPAEQLHGVYTELLVASAQVKSALLLAGLDAQGETVVVEPALSRDHSERMLSCFGCRIIRHGLSVRVVGGDRLQAARIIVPGDISSATFLIIAATLIANSDLVIEQVGLNETRLGALRILRAMGADIEVLKQNIVCQEPVGDLRIRSATLSGIEIPIDWVPSAIDEFPALFIAAACAEGHTYLRGAKELRVKESDRIATMAEGLQACGIAVEVYDDGIAIEGGRLKGATVDSRGDHRVAMAFAVAGAVAEQTISIQRCQNIDTSFPNFVQVANTIGLKLSH
ncbi:MAG: 3-phosphoshikimate 1-carboxyvinyltransferase [Chromatiales bacterium]|nr:3-phosphoshikimate 1-carboxyvinyltransferase [Chromatiales bacterium]